MSTRDTFPWHGPTCPQCDTELDVEPLTTTVGLRIGYACDQHGIVSITDPFDAA